MSTRITQRLMTERSLSSLQLGLGRLADTQEKLSTGRAINRPSDSPTLTNDAMRLRAQISADDQYVRNAQDGLSWLGTADTTLSSMSDSVRRARDLLVQGASTGSSGPEAREAMAQELIQIREDLLAQANTRHLGRPLFGGTTGNTTAYDSNGVFQGDSFAVNRAVGDGASIVVNTAGPDAFSVAGDDLFTMLDDAITTMRANPDALGGVLDRLDAVAGQMRTSLADVGVRYGRIESAMQRLATTAIDHKSSLSEVENVDFAQTVVELQMQEVAYQASLGATARVMQPSLIDFLR